MVCHISWRIRTKALLHTFIFLSQSLLLLPSPDNASFSTLLKYPFHPSHYTLLSPFPSLLVIPSLLPSISQRPLSINPRNYSNHQRCSSKVTPGPLPLTPPYPLFPPFTPSHSPPTLLFFWPHPFLPLSYHYPLSTLHYHKLTFPVVILTSIFQAFLSRTQLSM